MIPTENSLLSCLLFASVNIDFSLLVPDLTIKLTKTGRVEFEDKSMTIEEMKTWIRNSDSITKPAVVLLKVNGDTRTTVVDKAQDALREWFGNFTLLMGVE